MVNFRFSNLADKAKSISVLKKMTLSYIVIIILLSAVIGLTSYRMSSSNYESEVIKLNHQLLEQYSNLINTQIIDSVKAKRKEMMLNVSLNTDLDVLFEEDYNLGKIKTLRDEVLTITNTSEGLLEAIHIYSKENDFFLSTTLGLKYNNERNQLYWPNLSWIEAIEDMQSNEVWLSTRTVSYTSTTSVNVVSYICTYPSTMSFENAKGYISFDINEEYLKDILVNINLGGQGQIFLIDYSGNIITHSEEITMPATIFDLGFSTVDNFFSDSEDFIQDISGTKHIVSYISLGENWKLVRSIPIDEFYSVSYKIGFSILISCFIAMAASIFISRLFVSSIYSPLEGILKKVHQTFVHEKLPGNEYTIIDYALTNYNTQLTELNKKWEDNLINFKQNLLRNILNNTIYSMDEFKKRMKLIGIKASEGLYNILIIHIIDSDAQEIMVKDQKLVIGALSGYVETLSDDKTSFIASDVSSDRVAALIISKDSNINKKLKEIIAFTSNQLFIDVDISIGAWQKSPLVCHVSYKEALNVYGYRYFMPMENIFSVNQFNFTKDYDSSGTLNKLYGQYSNCIKTGDIKQAQKIISTFIQNIIKCDFSLRYRFKCLEALANELHDYCKEYNINEDSKKVDVNNSIFGFCDIYEYEKWLTQATYHIIELKKNQSDRKVDDIVYNIKCYIKEHLADELSLTSLSEYTTLSNSYLSHIFKETTGINVVDYITEQRMMRAKYLLETTSLNIESVALSCGYGTPHYFSKKFKQYFGLSPRSYRIANRPSETV